MIEREFSSNLSPEEFKRFRRWTCGLYLFYVAAVVVTVGLNIAERPRREIASWEAQPTLGRQSLAKDNASNSVVAKP